MDGQKPTVVEKTSATSWIWWVFLLVLVVIAALLIWWQGPSAGAPEIGTEDHTSAIDAQLSGIDLNDLESEFESIDADLGRL